MSDYSEMADALEIALANARRTGFRVGVAFTLLPVLGGLVFLCAAQVWLAERAEEKRSHAEVESAACHAELLNRRTSEAVLRTCVNGYNAVNNELENLVRSCR